MSIPNIYDGSVSQNHDVVPMVVETSGAASGRMIFTRCYSRSESFFWAHRLTIRLQM